MTPIEAFHVHQPLSAKQIGPLFLVALAALALLPSCSKPGAAADAAKGKSRLVDVAVATAATAAIPLEMNTFGNVESISTVTIRSQVNEILTAVHFRKGQNVKKGQLLFSFDPRASEAALKQAQATVTGHMVQAENAHNDLKRELDLLKKGVATQYECDQAQTIANAFDSAVRAGQAAVDTAKLQLEHCQIFSPIDGQVGNLLVNEGNLVKANDTALVVINQIRPIEVNFSVPQADLPTIRKYMAAGKLALKAAIPSQPEEPQTGELTFVDNAVDSASGTIAMRGTFENKDLRLWPGQYVQVNLLLTVQKDAVVVPAKAVQTGRDGKYVFVINSQMKAEMRPITIGRKCDDLLVVEKGLAPGERVVTNEFLRLTAGAPVRITNDPPSSQTMPATSEALSQGAGA